MTGQDRAYLWIATTAALMAAIWSNPWSTSSQCQYLKPVPDHPGVLECAKKP